MPNADTKRRPMKITVAIRMSREIKDAINKAAYDQRITKSAVVEIAVARLLKLKKKAA